MNKGLLIKSFREIGPITLGFGLLLLLAETAVSFIVPQINGEMFGMLLKMDFVRNLIGALVGTPATKDIGVNLGQAFPWIDPPVIAIIFAHAVAVCTALPAGEVDRGTIDVLLSMPVSRWRVYACHSVVWGFSGVVLFAMALAGNRIGTLLAHAPMAPAARLGITLFNAWCFYFAIGGFCYLVSSLSERRSRAIGVMIAVIVVSFLLNFMAGSWAPARRINFLSVLNYYRPIFIMQSGKWPLKDLAVLLLSGGGFWLAGGVIFHRRDVHVL